MLGLILVGLWISQEDGPGLQSEQFGGSGPLESEQYGGRTPRRPIMGPEYIIEDPREIGDSQGTAFVVDTDGVWLTAEHVTRSCSRLGFLGSGRYLTEARRVIESREADVALIRDGPEASGALRIDDRRPRAGDVAYHMGFPAGEPAVVASRFIGTANARRGGGAEGGHVEPIYAWAEINRFPASVGSLGGISGGPTLDSRGMVIGINSASTNRRGRVLTTDPEAIERLVIASQDVDEQPRAQPIANPDAAVRRFEQLRGAGLIRLVYCDVQ